MPEGWQWLLTYAVPGIGALLGSWFGARIALNRFRSERSFDRRLEWLERVHRQAGQAYNAWAEMYVYHGMDRMPPQIAMDAQQAHYSEFAAAAALVRLYGSSSLRDAAEPILEEFGLHTQAIASAMMRDAPRSEIADRMQRQMEILIEVQNLVADHGRDHLRIRD